MRCLLVDNYDSFTFNLYQLVYDVVGAEPVVVRNDRISWAAIEELDCDSIILSPGPGRPDRPADFGVCTDVIRFANVPVLGVCLGHQGIGHVCGAAVVHAPEPMHGRLSSVLHDGSELFRGIPTGFGAVRYHSLIVAEPLPEELECIARTPDGLVMGLRHRERPLWGVQFHPESISTEHGVQLIENFAAIVRRRCRRLRTWTATEVSDRSVVPVEHVPRAVSTTYQLRIRKLDQRSESEDTFVSLFGTQDVAFWLDSSLCGRDDHEPRRARFSFMGDVRGPHALRCTYRAASRQVEVVEAGQVRHEDGDVFEFLDRELEKRRVQRCGLPFDFHCGFVGYFGYELKADWTPAVWTSRQPDAQFILADRLVAFDHLTRTVYLVALATPGTAADADAWLDATAARMADIPVAAVAQPNGARVEFSLERDPATYLADIETCLAQIRDGESYEICLTNKVLARTRVAPLELYRALRQINPAPYSAFLKLPGVSVACSSPEQFLKITADGMIETKPIKGTAPRGATEAEDERLKDDLRLDAKSRSENLMIADLLRNDLGAVSSAGSVHVPKLMQVETYATVHQLVTTVRSRLRPDLNAVDCVRACFPGGSMTGAPKLRTTQIIDSLETSARGIYSGAIGFLSLDGSADLNIVIRTAVIEDDLITIGAGGAIVALSDPNEEVEEIMLKAQAIMRAVLACTRGGDVEPEPP